MLTKGGHTPVPFLESLAADSGRPVMIAALLHNSTNPQAVFDDLDAIAAANARGHPLHRPGVVLPADDGLHDALAVSGRRARELEARARPAGRCAQGDARRAGVSRRRARRAGNAATFPPVQRRVGQGAGGRNRRPQPRALRTANHRRHRAPSRPRPARRDARPRARREPGDRLHRAAAQFRRRGGRPHAQPSAQHRQPERRRRAPDLLQRRRLRPAPAGPLGARAAG